MTVAGNSSPELRWVKSGHVGLNGRISDKNNVNKKLIVSVVYPNLDITWAS